MYVALRLPPALRATVRPLALTSPALKLSVELVGLDSGSGPTKTAQPPVESATVTLPVTAVAFDGTPPRPATPNVAGVLADRGAVRPLPARVSRRRAGLRA